MSNLHWQDKEFISNGLLLKNIGGLAFGEILPEGWSSHDSS